MPEYLLPGPIAVALELIDFMGYLVVQFYVTFLETLTGFLLGATVGIALAVLMAYSKFCRTTILPLIVAAKALPEVATAPLLVIWFGLGISSKVAMVFLITFFPILINTVSGLMNIDFDMMDLMHLMRAKEWQIFFKLRLPHALTHIFDGLKISAPLSVVGAVIGEFVSAQEGLGNLVLVTMNSMNTRLMFASIIFITIIALILFAAVVIIEGIVIKWKPKER